MAKEPIAIIGPGRVGSALGARLGAAGWPVIYGTRDPDREGLAELASRSGGARLMSPADAVQSADLILFAVPWVAAEATLRALPPLDGKVLVDTTNPLRYADGREYEVEVPHSAAEAIQSWSPKAFVVKAFNATNFRIMANPGVVDGPISIPMAGDNAGAKARVAALIVDAGFSPTDAGPLSTAHYIEKLAAFYLSFLFQDRPDAVEFYLRPRPANKLLFPE